MQISPNKNVNFRCTSSSSTVESVGNGFVVYGQLTSGSLLASMTFLFVASQLWREMWWATQVGRMESLLSYRIAHFSTHFAGFLPTVDRSSAVALALYFN